MYTITSFVRSVSMDTWQEEQIKRMTVSLLQEVLQSFSDEIIVAGGKRAVLDLRGVVCACGSRRV